MRDIKAIVSNVLVVLIFLTGGCSGRGSTDPAGYIKYMHNPKNGMIQEKTLGSIKYGAMYLTPEAMTLMELKDSATQKSFGNLLPQYQGLQYVRFNIQPFGKGHIYNSVRQSDEDPGDIERYLNQDAQKDFFIVSGKDTSKCVLYAFSKTFGLGVNWEMMLGFEKKDTVDDIYLKFDDKVTDSGLLSFRYKRKDVLTLPLIHFDL